MRGEDFEQLSLLQAGSYYRIIELGKTLEFYIGKLSHCTDGKRLVLSVDFEAIGSAGGGTKNLDRCTVT